MKTVGKAISYNNAATYFEIPVNDMKRASAFYESVFGYRFEFMEIDGNEMALFPYDKNSSGITGALAKGESYIPGKQGVRIYLQSSDIEDTLRKTENSGGKVIYPLTEVGDWGKIAEIEDSESNCIGIHQRP